MTLNQPLTHLNIDYEAYPVCDEYTFCSHLLPEKAMCLVFIMTTWSPQSSTMQKLVESIKGTIGAINQNNY